jgi:outer membrane protein
LVANAGTFLDDYRLAVENDQTLAAARFQRDAAVEAKPQALSAILPQLGFQASEQKNHFQVFSVTDPSNTTYKPYSESFNSSVFGLQLTQVIFNWSAFKKLASADSSVAQAEAALRSAEQNLGIRYASAYLAVLSALDVLKVDTEAQAVYREQLEQQNTMYKTGAASITDVKNAQASYDTSTATVVADKVALNAAKRALGVIVGTPVDSVDPIRDEIPLVAPNPPTVESWITSASENNLDLLTARYAAEAANKQISAASGARLPTLSAVGSVGRNDSSSVFGYNSQTDYLGLTLNWSLLSGGQVSSSIRQAAATYNQAQAAYKLQMQTTDENVRNHFEGIVSGIENIKASANAVTSQQASVVATVVGYKVGTRTVIDVLNTRQLLATAEKTLAQARYAYLSSLLQLKADVSQLSPSDMEDIDRLSIGAADRKRGRE